MKLRRRKRKPRPPRFALRRRVGAWILLYDKGAADGEKNRWYVADIRDRLTFGPYYRATAEAVFEAVAKVRPL